MSHFCISLFFPPIGVAQEDDHVTGHPWGQVLNLRKKEVCKFGYCCRFYKPVFASKTAVLEFLPGNNYPDLHHSQGVWNLPHKFHLYLIVIFILNYFYSLVSYNFLVSLFVRKFGQIVVCLLHDILARCSILFTI